MKRVCFSILFCFLSVTAFGQSDELSAMASRLQELTGSVRTASRTYESKISFVEPAGIRYAVDEIDRNGRRIHHEYEFNIADIDPYAIREQTRNDTIIVVLAIKNKQRLVKISRNNEAQAYVEQALIYAKDIENARQIGDTVRNAIPYAERIMSDRLKLDGYEAMVGWLTKNVWNVSLGKTSYRQTIAETGSTGSLRFTRIESDGRRSVEDTFIFNLADINPHSIMSRTAGNRFMIYFQTLQKARHITARRNGETRPFVNEITIHTGNVNEANDLKTVLTMLIPLAAEKVKTDMPAINSSDDAVAQIKSLTTEITFGPRRVSQTVEPRCFTELTQVERDARSSEKNEFRFSWMDVNSNNSLIDIFGERLFVNIKITDGKRLISSSKNGRFNGYDNSVRLFMPDIESARRAKFAIDKAVEMCNAVYKEPFGDNAESIASWLVNNIKDVSVEQVTLAQKLETVEPGNVNKWKFTRRELNPRGSGNEDVFEFSLSDINPLSIEMTTSGRWLFVVMGTEFRSRVVKVYRNGKIMPYVNRIEFAINDADLARNVINALKQAPKAGSSPSSNETAGVDALADVGKPGEILYVSTAATTLPVKIDTKTSRIDIASDPVGAEVEIDGNFVGSTPLSVDIPAGEYEIVLKKKGFHDWSRRFKVIGSNVGINAELEPEETSAVSGVPAVDAPVDRTEPAGTQTIPSPNLASEKEPKSTAPVASASPLSTVPAPPQPAVSAPPVSATSGIPAPPPAKSYDARKGTHDIVDLVENQIVEVEIQGRNITSVSVRVRSLVDYPVTVLVPVGSFFVSANPSAQNMVATAESRITLGNSDWRTVSVSAACANRPRDIPDGNDRFTVLRSPQQKELAALMPVLDKANVNTSVRQAAVWIVTDNADYSDLGILISSPVNTRVIGYESAAGAMRICSDAGIDIREKRIWRDRQTILNNLPDGSLKTWLQSFGEETDKA